MTVAMLREHGVEVDDSDANRWAVAPGPIKAVDHLIEPDLSNAAPFLALAAVSGGTVTVRDWPRATTQAGDALREILTRMGCDGRARRRRPAGPRHRRRSQGVDVDLHDVGELTPGRRGAVRAGRVARPTCAASPTSAATRPTGSPRSPPSSAASAPTSPSTPTACRSRPAPLHGGVFHTYADHRMAHAGVIVGAAVDGVLVENIATTGKTFPDFAGFWSGLL